MTKSVLVLAFALVFGASACGDDDGAVDSGAVDSGATDSSTTDSSTTDSSTTDVGVDDANLDGNTGDAVAEGCAACDAASEVCVEGNFGGPTQLTCEAVTRGCEGDRTCACLAETYCPAPAACTDMGDNHIFCETGRD